jgi:stage V sporulation protein S
MDVIKVSTKSRTSAVAGAIAGVFRTHHQAIIQAIGAGAVNQMVKSLVLARNYLESDGLEVVFTPEFIEVEIDGKTRTAIRFQAFLRFPDAAPPLPTIRAAESLPEEPTEETPIESSEDTSIDTTETEL